MFVSRSRFTVASVAVALVVMLVIPVGCSMQTSGAAPTDGAGLVKVKCSRCHSLGRVESVRKTAEGWSATVDRMASHGLQVTQEQQATMVAYLSQAYGQ